MRIDVRAWGLRLLLACLFIAAADVWLWMDAARPFAVLDPPPAQRWLLTIGGSIALAALTLELMAFYRARNLYDVMALAGIYGLAAGLLLYPQSALADVPRTLFTRVMGAHSLAGLLAIAAWLVLATGRGRAGLVIGMAIAGVVWGVWAYWIPVELGRQRHPTWLPDMAAAAGAIAVMILLLCFWLSRRPRSFSPLPPGAGVVLRLTRLDWGITLALLLMPLLLRLLEGGIDSFAWTTIPLLIAFCIAVLYFQRRKKGATLLDGAGDPAATRRAPTAWAAGAIAFGAASLIGLSLSRGGDTDPFEIIAAVFTGYGLFWLPAVSLVLGARAFIRQARAQRL